MKKYKFTIRGNDYQVQVNSFEDNIAEVDVNGTIYQVELEQEVKTTKTPKFVRSKPIPTQETKPEPALRLSKVIAPLPGTILKINVKEGDAVKKGDVLLIMEAMKMENNIMAEVNGVVKSLKIKESDNVLQGDILIEIE